MMHSVHKEFFLGAFWYHCSGNKRKSAEENSKLQLEQKV